MTLSCKMPKILLQNAKAILLQNASGFLQQNATVLLQNATISLQNATVITKCDVYYKMCRYTYGPDKIIVNFSSYRLNNQEKWFLC